MNQYTLSREKKDLTAWQKRLRVDGIVFPNYRTAQEEQKRLVHYCQKLGLEMLVLPSVEEMSDGQLPRPQMKETV